MIFRCFENVGILINITVGPLPTRIKNESHISMWKQSSQLEGTCTDEDQCIDVYYAIMDIGLC